MEERGQREERAELAEILGPLIEGKINHELGLETQQTIIAGATLWLAVWEREHPEVKLTDAQRAWLQRRLIYRDDASASRAIGYDHCVATQWNLQAGFAAARAALLQYAAEVQNQEISALVFKALEVHRKLLDSDNEDIQERAVRLAYSAAGRLGPRVSIRDNRRQALILLQEMERKPIIEASYEPSALAEAGV